jgi:hypothetical protein
LEAEGQGRQRQQEQAGVQEDLPADPQPGAGEVGVEVARQQQRLEEDHAGVPDRRGAAQQGQHHLGNDRLDQEQQGRVKEERDREQGGQADPRGGRRLAEVV